MKRLIETHLHNWKNRPHRKPVILRGARQVGKTYIVREFGKTFKNFVEINFERNQDARKIFTYDLDPKRIIRDLSILLNDDIEAGTTLLFLDEIQIEPNAIAALRYLYEEIPDLHVIAAGSLLDFALEKHGIPVGRVSFLHLYPMSFLEFLYASESELLIEDILSYDFDSNTPFRHHEKLLKKLSEYLAIGGMPEAVKTWTLSNSLSDCQRVHLNIIEAYRQDFGKYAKRHQIKYIDIIFNKIPLLLSKKIKYSNISDTYKARELAPSLELLRKASIIHHVFQTTSKNVPLGANINHLHFKSIFLDVGLSQTILGLDLGDWILHPKRCLENKGEIVEAFVGQELLAYSNPEKDEKLYYWHSEKRGSIAELDYLIQQQNRILPIEVKSGITGGLKSLVRYVKDTAAAHHGIHLSLREFTRKELYNSLPLYMIAKLFDESTSCE